MPYTKRQLVDALKAHNVPDEEMQGQTNEQLAKRLSAINKQKITEKEIPEEPENLKTIEITRSYSRKVNLGNYQSEDYFCSRKAEVEKGDDLRAVSNWLAYECKIDVENQINKKTTGKDKVPF